METPAKRTVHWILIAAGALCLLVAALGAFGLYDVSALRVAMARGQIDVFLHMREKAKDAGVQEACSCLEYSVTYYPSGTKQQPGTHLDHMVEAVRHDVVQDIVAALRIMRYLPASRSAALSSTIARASQGISDHSCLAALAAAIALCTWASSAL